ncbi:MAG: thiol reductant ABC exporter subunit CydC, partial [Propionibacteriaceae bacterium]|nr:thiol reductant ABC exporter subunit CydC [Propionibacteriaceae bacterium]
MAPDRQPSARGFFLDFTNPLAKPKPELLPEETDSVVQDLKPGRSPLLRLVAWLLQAVPRGRSRLIAAVLLAAGASGSSVALMGVSAWLISRAAEHPNFLELTVAAVGVRTFAIARAVFRYVERLVGHDLALRLQSALRLRVYHRLARTTLLGRARGDLLVRVVADVAASEDVVVRIILPFTSAAIVVLGACGLLAAWSWPVALVLLLSSVLGGLIVPWLSQRISLRADQAAVPLRGQLGAQIHSLAQTAPDLAAYGVAEVALARVSQTDAQLRQVENRSAWAQGLGSGLQVIAAGLSVIGGLWLGAAAVVAGDLNRTMVAVFVLTPLALHEVFANFAQAAQTQTRAGAALARVTTLMKAPSVGQGDAPSHPITTQPRIDLTAVSVGWPHHDPVLTNIDLSLRPGHSLAVMGPSGIGKTTLAATIMGLIPAPAGQVEVEGRIGYLAQDAHIFATT